MEAVYRILQRRAFSMVELSATLLVLGLLTAIAYTSLTFFRAESRERSALSSLESVAAAQESYYVSRGQWATTSDSLANFGQTVDVITAASGSTSQVSVGSVSHQGQPALGLAVLVEPGRCLTLAITPPDSGQTFEPVRHDLGAYEPCTAALAGS